LKLNSTRKPIVLKVDPKKLKDIKETKRLRAHKKEQDVTENSESE
jgi:hypothetical protein